MPDVPEDQVPTIVGQLIQGGSTAISLQKQPNGLWTITA